MLGTYVVWNVAKNHSTLVYGNIIPFSLPTKVLTASTRLVYSPRGSIPALTIRANSSRHIGRYTAIERTRVILKGG